MLSQRVLILGATGGTGRHLVDQIVDAGHHVTAFVRHPATLTRTHDQLHVVAGALPDDAAMLKQAMRGQDVVVCSLGRGMSLKSERLMQTCVPVVLAAMKEERVGRLLYLSALGVGKTFRIAPLASKFLIGTLLRDIYADKNIAESLVISSDREWTIVHPPLLTDGPLTGRYRSAEDLRLPGFPKISRADVAHFMTGELTNRAFTRKIAIIGH